MVGVFGVQPPGGGQLPGAGLQPGRGLLGHLQRMPGQRGRGRMLLAGLGQPLQPVGAQGLQHQVAGPAIGPGAGRGEQRAVNQVQHRRLGDGPGDRLGGIQRERAGKTASRRNTRRSSSLSSW